MTQSESPVIEVIANLSDYVVKQPSALDASFATLRGCVEIFMADLAGILISDHGSGLRVFACSHEDDESLALLDAQRNHPSSSGMINGESTTSSVRLDGQTDDSQFIQLARHAGFAEIVSTPLTVRDSRIGVLTVLWRKVPTLTTDHFLTLETFANLTSAALVSEYLETDERTLASLLESTFQDRIALEQAKGMVAQILNCSIQEAFVVLKQLAERDRIPLRLAARRVLNRSISADSIAALRG